MLQIRNLASVKAFQAVTGYKYTVPEAMLKAGVNPSAADTRLRRVLLKWLSGQQVKLGVLGGSISYGYHAEHIGKDDYFSVVAKFFGAAHKQAKVKSRNGCVSSTGSKYMSMCLDSHVDADVDLLLIEYCVNDSYYPGQFASTPGKGYEQLVRRAMALPHSPSLVLAMYFHWAFNYTDGVVNPFWRSSQEYYNTVGSYYHLSWVSSRDALYHAAMVKQKGFRKQDFTDDAIHPNTYGHKVHADLFVYLVQRTLLDMALDPTLDAVLGPDPATADPNAPAILKKVKNLADVYPLTPLPPPLVANNYPPKYAKCYGADRLPGLMRAAAGFKFGQDVRPGVHHAHKWGYIAHAAGAKLTLHVPILTPGAPLKEGEKVTVLIGLLLSFHDVGVGRFECVSGCKCEPKVVDCYHEEKSSQVYPTNINVLAHKDCRISVEVLKNTSTGSHKFKVSTLGVLKLA